MTNDDWEEFINDPANFPIIKKRAPQSWSNTRIITIHDHVALKSDDLETECTQADRSRISIDVNDLISKDYVNKIPNMKIDYALDLHNFCSLSALEALKDFICAKWNEGAKLVLVITGIGVAKGSGIIKNSIGHWLNDDAIRRYILYAGWARRKHGGQGALYVLLRKKIAK